jgi:hypothetical protein
MPAITSAREAAALPVEYITAMFVNAPRRKTKGNGATNILASVVTGVASALLFGA